MRISRWKAATASAAVLGCVVALGATGPSIRSRVARAASARGLNAEIGAVHVGWLAVSLTDVHAFLPKSSILDVRIQAVQIELTAGLSVGAIAARGVEIRLSGSREDIESALRSLRKEGSAPRSNAPVPSLSADDISVVWREHAGAAPIVEVTGARAVRDERGWEGFLERAKARSAKVALDVASADARVDLHGQIQGSHASAVTVSFLRRLEEPAAPDASAAGEAPPLPVGNVKQGSADPNIARKLRLPMPDLHAIRAGLSAASALAQERLAEGARLDVDSLRFAIDGGQRTFAAGQGPLGVERKGGALRVTFSTRANAQGTPLGLTASLPLGGGESVASLIGGPVSLSTLGVDEGAGSLIGVDAATVTGRGRLALAAGGETLTFDGELGVRGLAIENSRVAREAVRGLDVDVLARGVLDDHGGLRADDAEIAVGALRLIAHGQIEQTAERLAASLAVELPSTSCAALLTSIPSALIPSLDGAEMTGALGGRGTIAFDTAKLDDATFEWTVDDHCALATVPEELAKERFAQPFEHTIYEPDGTLEQETTGPTTDNWTDLGRISPFMQVAVLTTEDGAFFRHHGFNRAAMRNALVADLKAGRFARGASTITMQLAKNLFLSRDKTVSRKLEEVVLADYLESAFTKEEMMELYLNVIEFGPGVYGITQAAGHYFGRAPAELNLAECLFLASILPSPVRYAKLAEQPELTPSWTERLRALMKIAAKLGTISESELAEGLAEHVVFHRPGGPPVDARPPVAGTHFQSVRARADAEWQETP